MSLSDEFASACRRTRLRLDLTQQQVADAIGVSRTFIARVERARTPVTLADVERISVALGMRTALTLTPPIFLAEARVGDRVHASCVGYVTRRLVAEGWLVAAEVDVGDGPVRGWIDLMAFDPRTGTLLIIEMKTRLADLGGLQRQINWYERHALSAARSLGWRPRRIGSWVLGVASAELEASLLMHRDVFDREFPARATGMLPVIAGQEWGGRALALIDPASRRRAWLIRTRLDGRRSAPPYRDYVDAARRLSR